MILLHQLQFMFSMSNIIQNSRLYRTPLNPCYFVRPQLFTPTEEGRRGSKMENQQKTGGGEDLGGAHW